MSAVGANGHADRMRDVCLSGRRRHPPLPTIAHRSFEFFRWGAEPLSGHYDVNKQIAQEMSGKLRNRVLPYRQGAAFCSLGVRKFWSIRSAAMRPLTHKRAALPSRFDRHVRSWMTEHAARYQVPRARAQGRRISVPSSFRDKRRSRPTDWRLGHIPRPAHEHGCMKIDGAARIAGDVRRVPEPRIDTLPYLLDAHLRMRFHRLGRFSTPDLVGIEPGAIERLQRVGEIEHPLKVIRPLRGIPATSGCKGHREVILSIPINGAGILYCVT
jgi:hypothetical protein